MERFDKWEFDFENNVGKKIWMIECINIKGDVAVDSFICANEEEAKRNCEEMNKTNKDKRYEFVYSEYTVEEDGLICG